ncbi:hypothetical protein SH580_19130 [Coraliomargarita algicola]|uniref:PEP-CTERM protein-sorting domain-containing protein n=1 Tax=Coraliomargarita algicola TaxID=3092156 RepID=A0ABZ0RH74_9BACT|nr:hypothetical protein [Coraliomargarita sp. J2-16]WPJ95534.1 hypothetical protein SH580_19130 [Coraliomargarita sp. J2-16]
MKRSDTHTILYSLAFFASAMLANASTIINPNTPTSNIAANAGSSLNFLVGGTADDGGSSLTFDSSSTTLATGTDASIALATSHALDSIDGSYVTPTTGSNTNYFDSGTPPILTFTLDQVYDNIDSVILWNYSHDNEANLTKDFTITFFSDTGASNQVGIVESGQMALRDGAATSVAAEQFTFDATYSGIQSFTITLASNWNGNRVGLSEVRLTQIPEPQTFALLAGFCALGLAMLRRR